MEMSVFFSAIFIFGGQILQLSMVVSTMRINMYDIYNALLLLLIVVTTIDSCKICPPKMKMALKKTLISIFSPQFFENKNI